MTRNSNSSINSIRVIETMEIITLLMMRVIVASNCQISYRVIINCILQKKWLIIIVATALAIEYSSHKITS